MFSAFRLWWIVIVGGSDGVYACSSVGVAAVTSAAFDATLLPRWAYGGTRVLGVFSGGDCWECGCSYFVRKRI